MCVFLKKADPSTEIEQVKEKDKMGSFSPAFNVSGMAVAWWLMPRTPDPEVGGSSPTRVKPCCVLE